MKISDLRKREDFDNILSNTLKEFLLSFTKHSHSVVVCKFPNMFNNGDFDVLIYNPSIDSIFHKDFDPEVFSHILAEYNHAPWNNIPRAAKFLFVQLATSKIFCQFMTGLRVQVTKNSVLHKRSLIIGGNNKIRILDYRHNLVYVVTKSGFSKKYMEREIYVKENFSELPVPKLLSKNLGDGWYTEELVSGQPLYTVSQSEREAYLSQIGPKLYKVRKRTRTVKDVAIYSKEIRNELFLILDQCIDILSPQKIKDWKKLIDSLISIIDPTNISSVTLSHSHGDLHDGNFIVKDKTCYIIDWENSGVRSCSYDLILLLLGRRSHQKFVDRMLNICSGKLHYHNQSIPDLWPDVVWGDLEHRKFCLKLFLIEDLLFYFEEYKSAHIFNSENDFNKKFSDYKSLLLFLKRGESYEWNDEKNI